MALLASGASLRHQDVDYLRGRCSAIAINQAYRLAPWAAWLYACDAAFWLYAHNRAALAFAGQRIVVRPARPAVSSDVRKVARAGVNVLAHAGRGLEGVSADPGVVRGNNSLAQILSVITHTGAARVLLLGADMSPGRWYDRAGHRTPEPPYSSKVVPTFDSLVQPLAAAGITVLNCAPASALRCWPRVSLEEVL